MAISVDTIEQFIQRGKAGHFSDEDADAFFQNPRLWRGPAVAAVPVTPETAQAFWQGVYDELGIKVEVPPVPELTDKQVKSIERFGFLLVYVPRITEDQYPKGFVKPGWGQYLTISDIERLPLKGRWVAVEKIAKPHFDDSCGYDYGSDALMIAVKHPKRFYTSHDDLVGGLLAKIAKTTGFPKKGTRLPTAEEWNLIGNLFNWLREHRQMNLPDLGSTRSLEWCANPFGSEARLIAGYSDSGGLANVHSAPSAYHDDDFAFRVLVVL